MLCYKPGKPKRRVLSLDLLRGIAVLCMEVGHTLANGHVDLSPVLSDHPWVTIMILPLLIVANWKGIFATISGCVIGYRILTSHAKTIKRRRTKGEKGEVMGPHIAQAVTAGLVYLVVWFGLTLILILSNVIDAWVRVSTFTYEACAGIVPDTQFMQWLKDSLHCQESRPCGSHSVLIRPDDMKAAERERERAIRRERLRVRTRGIDTTGHSQGTVGGVHRDRLIVRDYTWPERHRERERGVHCHRERDSPTLRSVAAVDSFGIAGHMCPVRGAPIPNRTANRHATTRYTKASETTRSKTHPRPMSLTSTVRNAGPKVSYLQVRVPTSKVRDFRVSAEEGGRETQREREAYQYTGVGGHTDTLS
ncbi:hypothetical protein KIPB_002767 [Kipferlia bialata]|uniref:Uncharacterized protein n=1 Tax=Kipferlia bialata TaxID=797122 RepID=A0A9K3CSA4_9EUKA|nr:hypothetical protein KIPB_002767 [Kipferlia bialata]|eukprot:g2767.t1